jgi:hypothetical protein
LCLLAAVLAVASVAAQTAQSQAPAKARRPLLAAVRAQFVRARLTPEQKQQLRSIFQAHQADIKALREKAMALRQAKASGAQVSPQDLQDLRAKRQAIVQAVRKEAMAILTPDQQKRLKILRKRLLRRLGR